MSFTNPKFNLPSGFHPDNYVATGKTVDSHLKGIDDSLALLATSASVNTLSETVNELAKVEGTFIADPTGGTTTDTQARTAIASILDILIANGLMAAS